MTKLKVETDSPKKKRLKVETHIMWSCKLSKFLLVDLLYSTPNHKPFSGCRQGFIKLPQGGPLILKNLT